MSEVCYMCGRDVPAGRWVPHTIGHLETEIYVCPACAREIGRGGQEIEERDKNSDDGELISTSGTRHCPYCGGPLRWHRLEDGTGGHEWCMECGYFSDW